MILSKTPFRVSFIGGGTDFEKFYSEYGGSVISTTINKHVYVAINRRFDEGFRISYSNNEYPKKLNEIDHPIVRNSIKDLCPNTYPLEIVSMADIPSEGSGLGSSSAFTVGLINSLSKFLQKDLTLHEIAEKACEIEIERCLSPIGKQDQYGCAFGGLKRISFNKDEIKVGKIYDNKISKLLENSTLFFFTGKKRKSSSVLTEIKNNLNFPSPKKYLKDLLNLTDHFHDSILNMDVEIAGEIIDQSWNIKKKLATNVSSEEIDNIYQIAKKSGAYGGKLLGAGNGGFFMFLAPIEKHSSIIQSLNFMQNINFKFDQKGTRIVYNSKQDLYE